MPKSFPLSPRGHPTHHFVATVALLAVALSGCEGGQPSNAMKSWNLQVTSADLVGGLNEIRITGLEDASVLLSMDSVWVTKPTVPESGGPKQGCWAYSFDSSSPHVEWIDPTSDEFVVSTEDRVVTFNDFYYFMHHVISVPSTTAGEFALLLWLPDFQGWRAAGADLTLNFNVTHRGDSPDIEIVGNPEVPLNCSLGLSDWSGGTRAGYSLGGVRSNVEPYRDVFYARDCSLALDIRGSGWIAIDVGAAIEVSLDVAAPNGTVVAALQSPGTGLVDAGPGSYQARLHSYTATRDGIFEPHIYMAWT